ncbi:hypothetical protein BRC93_02730 [Halobacteriales archaeon QS_5_70_15]|nr:MAG: hypothetical protein BRC93_02730 [Halobacteriales archaeon QS_5_70_15]
MSRRRLLAGVGLLALLVGLSGCTLFGPGSVNQGELADDPASEYEWDADTDAYLEVNRNNYTAVYRVGQRTTGSLEQPYTMELYERDALGTDQPLDPSSLQFRYENGSRLRFVDGEGDSANLVMFRENGSRVDVPEEKLVVNKTRRRTRVFLPSNETGQLAFTAPKNGKQVATPTFVRGSYEMVLPEGTSVGLPVLAQVSPGASRTETVDGRVHVYWDSVDRASSVVVRYYLDRDITLFGGMVALLVVLGAGGAVYYYRQIRETVRKREEVGLDVETDDESEGGGPPGFG